MKRTEKLGAGLSEHTNSTGRLCLLQTTPRVWFEVRLGIGAFLIDDRIAVIRAIANRS